MRKWNALANRFKMECLPVTHITISCLQTVFSRNKRSTPWGRVTHIGVGKLTMIGSDSDLSPDQQQAIIWINAIIVLIGPSGKLQWNLNRHSRIVIHENAYKNVVCKMTAIFLPQCINAPLWCITAVHVHKSPLVYAIMNKFHLCRSTALRYKTSLMN